MHALIDWLSLSFNQEYHLPSPLTFKKLDIKTKHFEIIEEIYYFENRIFTIMREPLSKIFNKSLHILKVDNWLLYHEDLFTILEKFFIYNNIILVNISRLDICSDFNRFQNNLHPNNFINYYLKNRYLKNGIVHHKLEGSQRFKGNWHQVSEYLRFGKASSEVSSYLYNKSLEMKQVKFKQYIFNSWLSNNINTNEDVWRLEFSLHPYRLGVIDFITGERISINYDAIKNAHFIQRLYINLIYKYFEFRRNTHIINKSEMPRVDLFIMPQQSFIFDKTDGKHDSTRADKILINKCLATFADLRVFSKFRSLKYYETAETHAFNSELVKYFDKKSCALGISKNRVEAMKNELLINNNGAF